MTETMQRRCDVADAARRMLDDGLVVGTSGNISARCGKYIAITPSGIEYQLLSPEDIVLWILTELSWGGSCALPPGWVFMYCCIGHATLEPSCIPTPDGPRPWPWVRVKFLP